MILAEKKRGGCSINFDVMYYAKGEDYDSIDEEIGAKEGELIREYRPPLNTQIPDEKNWRKYMRFMAKNWRYILLANHPILEDDKLPTPWTYNDYKKFEPILDEIIKFNKRYVKYLETDNLKGYNVLLDMYEEGMTKEKYDKYSQSFRSILFKTPLGA